LKGGRILTTVTSLPGSPNLSQLKNQAKSLLKSARAGNPTALARIHAQHPRISQPPTLADAQFVVALEHGFESWSKLKAHVESEAEPSENLVQRFKEAVEVGDATRAGRLLRQNPSLAKRIDSPLFSFGKPAIVQAATNQNRRLIGVLLKAGSNINARSDWSPGSWSALDQADQKTAKYLAQHGAAFTIHSAAKHGLTGMMQQMLLSDQSLANAPGGDGATPLHMAGTVPVCRLLLEYGADPEARDIDHGSTPAQWSIDNPPKVRFLVDHGATPDIFLACAIGDMSIAAAALERDRNCLGHRIGKAPFTGGKSDHLYMYTRGLGPTARPLQLAAQRGHGDLVAWLLPKASPAAKLIYACRVGDEALIQSVLEADPEIPKNMDPGDRAAIADAAWDNRPDVIERMLAAGFGIDTQGRESGTPVERAAIRGWPDTVRYLIERGASLEIPNQYGGAPLGAAIWGSDNWDRPDADYAECAELLIAAGAALPERVWGGSEAVRTVLRKHGVKD
jgi:ankyrin repeat protein